MDFLENNNFEARTGTGESQNHDNNTGYQGVPKLDFSKIRIGAQSLDDAILDIGVLKKVNPRLANKENVLKAINNNDIKTMREISEFFYNTSGIYSRMIKYMAYMYCYDWFVTPYVNDEKIKKEKILEGFQKCLTTLDSFNVKKNLGDIARKVLLNGVYYGYKVEQGNSIVLQELPPDFCRTRYSQGQKAAVEFNMKFFDTAFRDINQKMKVLKIFPAEFRKGYLLYKEGKLPAEAPGDDGGWYLLDPNMTVRFTYDGRERPAFISVIPLLLDLDAAQELDRKKMLQRLLKIVVQTMPMDKNGELIFDVEEAQQLHNNAVQMLGKAIGLDVLTTFADVKVESLSDTNAATAQADDLMRVERQVYNEWGGSHLLFNSDGNIALDKSVQNDVSALYPLVLQFEEFLNDIIAKFSNKKIEYRVQILKTTIYNYQDLAKLYKEQTQLGYSKMLPQIALGQSQSSILANAYFENDVLDLVNVFIPPLMSSTMNENILNRVKGSGSATPGESGDGKAGRKELADDKKSEKTIQNKESMS